MLVKFSNEYLKKLFAGEPLKGKPKFSDVVVSKYKKCVLILKNVESSKELSKIRGLNFEGSIRVDDGYRLEFKLEKDCIELTEIVIIEELSNHYK